MGVRLVPSSETVGPVRAVVAVGGFAIALLAACQGPPIGPPTEASSSSAAPLAVAASPVPIPWPSPPGQLDLMPSAWAVPVGAEVELMATPAYALPWRVLPQHAQRARWAGGKLQALSPGPVALEAAVAGLRFRWWTAVLGAEEDRGRHFAPPCSMGTASDLRVLGQKQLQALCGELGDPGSPFLKANAWLLHAYSHHSGRPQPPAPVLTRAEGALWVVAPWLDNPLTPFIAIAPAAGLSVKAWVIQDAEASWPVKHLP